MAQESERHMWYHTLGDQFIHAVKGAEVEVELASDIYFCVMGPPYLVPCALFGPPLAHLNATKASSKIPPQVATFAPIHELESTYISSPPEAADWYGKECYVG